jgi:hypothetical protein
MRYFGIEVVTHSLHESRFEPLGKAVTLCPPLIRIGTDGQGSLVREVFWKLRHARSGATALPSTDCGAAAPEPVRRVGVPRDTSRSRIQVAATVLFPLFPLQIGAGINTDGVR